MLGKIADFYEQEVDAAIANLLTLMEPLLIGFLGVTIGSIVIAMYLPLFTLIGKLSARPLNRSASIMRLWGDSIRVSPFSLSAVGSSLEEKRYPPDQLCVIGFGPMRILEEATAGKASLGRKLWWLIFGRVAVALFLVLVRLIWISGRNDTAWVQVLPALLIVFGLTLVYSLAHRFSRTLPFQARLQFALDIILVSWLNWTTDVIHSPYIALYIVIIAASSLFLGPRDRHHHLARLCGRFHCQRTRSIGRLRHPFQPRPDGDRRLANGPDGWTV